MNEARYGILSAFGTFAISSCVVAYPTASFLISVMGSALVGFCCALAGAFGETK